MSKFIDLTGQKFGKLTVLYRTDDYITPKDRHCVKWRCKCDCGNECDKTTQRLKNGCPYCSKQKLLKGFNDLATTNPELLNEWDYDKNTIKPDSVMSGSKTKVWWKCKFGHSYQATLNHRTSPESTGCPICISGRQTSFAEQAVYYYVKKVFPDAINRYKNIFGSRFELDIYIPSKRIAIEYDGFEWHQNNKNDNKKNLLCKAKNIKLIRIRENGLKPFDNCICFFRDYTKSFQNLSQIIIQIFNFIDKKIKINIDVVRDQIEIYSLYLNLIKENSLFSNFPELSKEWNYEKNGNLKPTMFTAGSKKKVWWKCSKCGNEWMAVIRSRSVGCGCPICGYKKAGQKISKKVAMVSFETNIILKTFNSIKEAVEKTGISQPTIISQCKGFRSSRADFYWKYI